MTPDGVRRRTAPPSKRKQRKEPERTVRLVSSEDEESSAPSSSDPLHRSPEGIAADAAAATEFAAKPQSPPRLIPRGPHSATTCPLASLVCDPCPLTPEQLRTLSDEGVLNLGMMFPPGFVPIQSAVDFLASKKTRPGWIRANLARRRRSEKDERWFTLPSSVALSGSVIKAVTSCTPECFNSYFRRWMTARGLLLNPVSPVPGWCLCKDNNPQHSHRDAHSDLRWVTCPRARRVLQRNPCACCFLWGNLSRYPSRVCYFRGSHLLPPGVYPPVESRRIFAADAGEAYMFTPGMIHYGCRTSKHATIRPWWENVIVPMLVSPSSSLRYLMSRKLMGTSDDAYSPVDPKPSDDAYTLEPFVKLSRLIPYHSASSAPAASPQ
jgi:hypothetical protein